MKLAGLLLIAAGVFFNHWTPGENVILLALGLFFCMKADIQAHRRRN